MSKIFQNITSTLLFFILATFAANAESKWETVEKEGDDAYYSGNFQQAVIKYKELAAILPSDKKDLLATTYYMIANSYLYLGYYENAFIYADRVLQIDIKSGNKDNLSHSYHLLGTIYLEQKYYSSAEDMFKKSLDLLKKINGSKFDICARLGMLSTTYLKWGKIQQAYETAKEAVEIARTDSDQINLAKRLSQLADAEMALKKYEQAEPHLNEAYEILVSKNYLPSLLIVEGQLAKFMLHYNRYEEAGQYCLQAIKICNITGQREEKLSLYQTLTLAYIKTSPEKALITYNLAKELDDSLKIVKAETIIADYRVKAETAEKDKQIEQAKTRNIILIILAVSLILVCTLLAFYVRAEKHRNQLIGQMSKAKDKFVALISHDLRNHVVAQQRALHMLADYSEQLTQKQIGDECTELSRSADSQVELLYNLLSWGQMQLGKIEVQNINFDLKEMTLEVIRTMEILLKNKGLTCIYEANEPIIIKSDRKVVSTILRNFLSNAIKFSYQGGNIYITTTTERISVRDEGAGMTEEQLTKLFTKKEASTTAGTKGEPGSGLGLSVCHEFAQQIDSVITAKSQKGQGCEISLEFGKKA